MITNSGKELISKYLLGQVPAYATHMSIGCGAKPLLDNESQPSSAVGKTMMDFEMTRVPISAKGFVDASQTFAVSNKQLVSATSTATLTLPSNHGILPGETVIITGVDSTFNGQYTVKSSATTTISYTKIGSDVSSTAVSPVGSCVVARTKMSFTAELPTDNRYEITEIGIWSAPSNSLAASSDSRVVFDFSQSWQIHDTSIYDPVLNTDVGDSGLDIVDNGQKVFYANTNDSLFKTEQRRDRFEGPRFLNRTLLVRGDLSTISYQNIATEWVGSGTHIHINGINLNISNNNVSDLFKLAFSVLDESGLTPTSFANVKILMEFYRSEINTTSGYAKAQMYVPYSTFTSSRHYVGSFNIGQSIDYSNYDSVTGGIADMNKPYISFITSPDFDSSEIRMCRIFASVVTNESTGAVTDAQYFAFDGFRLENTTDNPLYKMIGYSVVKNDGKPITKYENTNNYIDFRFNLGI